MKPDMPAMEGDGERNTLLQGLLWPALIEKLAALALRSGEVADLAETLEQSGRFLDRYTADPSDLGATARLLKSKLAQLTELSAQLSRQVMRHSHLLEDAATLASAGADPDPSTADEAGPSRR
jgi:hypothetical protein